MSELSKLAEALLQNGHATICVTGAEAGALLITVQLDDEYRTAIAGWNDVTRFTNRLLTHLVELYMRQVWAFGMQPHQLVNDTADYFGLGQAAVLAKRELLELAATIKEGVDGRWRQLVAHTAYTP